MTINPCSSILDYLAVRPDIGRWRIQFSASMISKLKSHVQALMITHFLHLSSSTLIPIYSWLSLSIKSNPFLVTFSDGLSNNTSLLPSSFVKDIKK